MFDVAIAVGIMFVLSSVVGCLVLWVASTPLRREAVRCQKVLDRAEAYRQGYE